MCFLSKIINEHIVSSLSPDKTLRMHVNSVNKGSGLTGKRVHYQQINTFDLMEAVHSLTQQITRSLSISSHNDVFSLLS